MKYIVYLILHIFVFWHSLKDTIFFKSSCLFVFFFFLKVLTLRTVHEQLVRLLSTSERQQLRTSEAFLPFSGLNPLHHNPYTEPLWRAAVAQYERGMAPAEQKIAGKLRQQLSNLSAMKSHQVSFIEFCLVYRNGISQLLITNHGIFLINQ